MAPNAGAMPFALKLCSVGLRRAALAKNALSVLRNFSFKVDPSGAMTAGISLDPVHGVGDAGDLNLDMVDMFLALGEAAKAHLARSAVESLHRCQFWQFLFQ